MDGGSRSKSQRRARTDEALAARNHPRHLRATRTAKPGARGCEDGGDGRSKAPRAVRAVEDRCGQLNWNVMERVREKGRCQVVENMVELVGIEPTTSSLRTMRSPS